MKKFILVISIIPILFTFGYKSNVTFNNLNKNTSENKQIILMNFEAEGNNSGITIDTNDDGYADTLYMWGNNEYGQIGDGTANNKFIPTKIIPSEQSDWGGNIINLSIGGYTSGVTIDTDLDGYADTLYMWGINNNGQIGDGTANNKFIPTKITPSEQSDWGGNIVDLSLSDLDSSVTIDTDLDGYADTLYMWGLNNYGQIGNGSSKLIYPTIITPKDQATWNGNIIDSSLSIHNTGLTIDSDLDGYADTLYMWGDNGYGQIGNGTSGSNILSPLIVTPQDEEWNGTINDIQLGDTYSSITVNTDTNIDENKYANTLYMWGDNGYGQLGNNNTTDLLVPTIITPQGENNWNGNIIDYSIGDNTSSSIIDNDLDGYADTLYMWGNNDHGKLGNNTTTNLLIPTIITPQDENNWIGNITDISLGKDHSGLLVDYNYDNIPDTIYLVGNDNYGQIGNGGNANDPDILKFTPIFSTIPNLLNTYQFYYNNNKLFISMDLNDILNSIDETTEVQIVDNNENIYDTTYIEDKSDIANDYYYYQINGEFDRGSNYIFEQIIINGYQFNLNDYSFTTDYLISDYTFVSPTTETMIIDLNLDQNSDNFDISDYTNDQLKIKVSYTDIDNNISNSQEFTLDQTNQITLTNLNAETNYRIDSINYFYEDNNYKYTIDQEVKIFQTSAATPLINADSISLVENSITETSFEYTIEIDNLKENANKDDFTQYDINNGIWLIDQDNQTYNSSFINEKVISDGEINGTQNYQITFLQENLTSGETYNFTGIGFNDPNGSDPDIINFSYLFKVTTILVNKEFVNNTFEINKDSITTNSFEYTIAIDNLILIDNEKEKPIFSNFNLDENIYLKDQNDNIYPSSYVNGSALNLGFKEENGTVKYQFNFKVNNLNENTTYNFVSLSFTDSFEESIDISEKGTIKTNNNENETIIIWISIIVLVVFILLILILIWIDLKMKKKTKQTNEKLNSYND